MMIKEIFPFPDFTDLLIAVLVFLVIVRPRGIVDIVPVLLNLLMGFFVLLSLLASTTLSRPGVIRIHVLIFRECRCPIGRRAFWLRARRLTLGVDRRGLRVRGLW